MGRSYYSILQYPFRPHVFWAGVCRLAWWAGGIPSRGLHAPLVLPVGVASRELRRCIRWETTLATSATGDAGPSPHQGQTVKLLGIPEGQRYRSGVATSLDTML